jgi:diaminopimelate decarboxylase
MPDPEVLPVLRRLAGELPTPSYVYFTDRMAGRVAQLKQAFADRFEISYAAKANPNGAVLRALRAAGCALDVSSAGEIERGLRAGFASSAISFSGPAKRDVELQRAIALSCGHVVCESVGEIRRLQNLAHAANARVPVLLRINPARVPKKFGLHLGGRASQFGVDAEVAATAIDAIAESPQLQLEGFHIHSGLNSLQEEGIAENFAIFAELFQQLSSEHRLRPKVLIFGSGFGIPYLHNDQPLSLDRLASLVHPILDGLHADPACTQARLVLEMGRWLVGPEGFLLTRVVDAKRSHDVEVRLCDAGFNNHLAACGMMGTVIRRNWAFWNLSSAADAPRSTYLLTGPLCASFDVLAQQIDLPETRVGDVLAIGTSGAYGLTASPFGFISHPPPAEFALTGDCEVGDVSEPLVVQ